MFNPDSHDLVYGWRGQEKVFKAMDVQTFDYDEAQNVKKYLYDQVVNSRDLNPIIDHSKIYKEIEL